MQKGFFNEKKAGFTLAETMIVFVVLGVIAVVTVPALISKHIESTNRTKVRKAMTVYDTALNKMVIENGIKDNKALYEDANSFAPNDNCTNTAPYFKVSKTLNNNICTFKAPDGLYWDISKINAPIIAFNEADLTNADAKNRFQLVGHFDNNGSLRVDDLAFETGNNKTALTKLYNYINNIKSEEDSEEQFCDSLCQLKKQDCDSSCKIEKYKRTICEDPGEYGSGYCEKCKSCSINYYGEIFVFDENGQKLAWLYDGGRGCSNDEIETCPVYEMWEYNSSGNVIIDKWSCGVDGKNCNGISIDDYDLSGNKIYYRGGCDGNGEKCTYCYTYSSEYVCKKDSDGYYYAEKKKPVVNQNPSSGNGSGSWSGSSWSGSGSGSWSGS